MVQKVDSCYSLPNIPPVLGVVQLSSPYCVSGLHDTHLFHCSPPLKRKWSERYTIFQRLLLHAFKYKILEAIAYHQDVLLTAPPASVKTTQVPQMILDDALAKWYLCRIVVSNLKTLGVMGCSGHVSTERGEDTTAESVGYSTKRRKSRPNSLDSILYVTEGTLLHILDNALFTHIIIDEVHERTVDVDVLLMKIRDLLATGCAVRVIIMSATADTSFIEDYFKSNTTTTLELHTESFHIFDYWLDDLAACPSWTCPSQVILYVYNTFQQLTHANAFLIFLADKQEIAACQV